MTEEIAYSEPHHPIAKKYLGYPGSDFGSKSGYSWSYPMHVVIYDATVLNENGDQLWVGDVDLTEDEDQFTDNLLALANEIGAVAVCPGEYGWEKDLPFKGTNALFMNRRDANGFTDEDDADYWQETYGIFVFHPDHPERARRRIAVSETRLRTLHEEREAERAREAAEMAAIAAEKAAQREATDRWNSGTGLQIKRPGIKNADDILYS